MNFDDILTELQPFEEQLKEDAVKQERNRAIEAVIFKKLNKIKDRSLSEDSTYKNEGCYHGTQKKIIINYLNANVLPKNPKPVQGVKWGYERVETFKNEDVVPVAKIRPKCFLVKSIAVKPTHDFHPHPLDESNTDTVNGKLRSIHPEVQCDFCKRKGSSLYYCRQCDWDICERCFTYQDINAPASTDETKLKLIKARKAIELLLLLNFKLLKKH
jgi:hypothetical protein